VGFGICHGGWHGWHGWHGRHSVVALRTGIRTLAVGGQGSLADGYGRPTAWRCPEDVDW